MSILDSKNKIFLLITTMASYAIIFIDESGIAVTLPQMQQALSLSNNAVHWIINSYLLTLSILLLLGGKLSDLYGKRRIFAIGTIIFLFASIICAIASNAWIMIMGRFIQGIGASLLTPCILVLIQHGFREDEFGKAFGLVLTVSNLFYALGPFIAGILTEFVSWRYFFWINIPIGLICLIFTYLAVEKDTPIQSKYFDWPGIITSIIALSALVIAMMQGAVWGWYSYRIISLFIIAIIGLIGFVQIELKSSEPLLDVRLFKNKEFFAGNIILFCSTLCLTLMIFWAIWLQTSVGFSPATVGLALLPATITFIFVPPLGGAWRDKSGSRAPLLLGTLLVFISIFWVLATINLQNYVWLFPGLFAFGIGLPLAIPNSSMVVMSAVQTHQSGMASGVVACSRQFALSFGIAILSAIMSSYYNSHLAHFLKTSSDYTHINIEQVNLLLAGNNKIITLPEHQLALLKNMAQHINTRGLFYGMLVMLVFSIIGYVLSSVFIKKRTLK